MFTIDKEEILSTTDVTKNFALCRKKTKELDRTIIFKNNKPDLVMLDIDHYENICKLLELLEDIDIQCILKERLKEDDGTRYSLEDIAEMFNLKL